jgi:hypothetical protein
MANPSGLRRHAQSFRPHALQTASRFAKSGAFGSDEAWSAQL